MEPVARSMPGHSQLQIVFSLRLAAHAGFSHAHHPHEPLFSNLSPQRETQHQRGWKQLSGPRWLCCGYHQGPHPDQFGEVSEKTPATVRSSSQRPSEQP